MTKKEKKEITRIAKEFASGFKEMIPSINGSEWLIVDPLSGYLSAIGIEHKVHQLPECDKHPQVLFLEFPDGTQFFPAGGDLKSISPEMKNWIWINP